MRRNLIAANWKLNGSTEMVGSLIGAIQEGFSELDNSVDVVIIPPAIFATLANAAMGKPGMHLGVQDVSRWKQGAYTGEVSAEMAKDVGCDYAIIGHSERRELLQENDAVVSEKVERALDAGLKPILCVGESLAEREANEQNAVVSRQLRAALGSLASDRLASVVVAYEPVWAIGTGKTATPEDAQSIHRLIREVLAEMKAPADEMTLLYGGSMKPGNAGELLSQPDIDGGLIGGASLKADDFLAICRAV